MDKTNHRALDSRNKPTLILPGNQRAVDLVRIRHSLIDWDYVDSAYLLINDTQFVTTPTSLRMGGTNNGALRPSAYLKSTLAPNVPDGRIITYIRQNGGQHQRLEPYFRVQSIPATGQSPNCYNIRMINTIAWFKRTVAGSDTNLLTLTLPNPISDNTWLPMRVTWWQWINVNLQKTLRILLEFYIAGNWVEQGYYDDTVNQWADSAINRVGIGSNFDTTGYYFWIDDTQIWKAIT